MKIKDKNGKFKHISPSEEWKEKFFKDNGSIENQLIEQAESPTEYKNKIKQWIKDNPKPIE